MYFENFYFLLINNTNDKMEEVASCDFKLFIFSKMGANISLAILHSGRTVEYGDSIPVEK